MKKIYTKTGDHGQTSLRGGVRVDKDDPRIEANGQLDMLNALLGMLPADDLLGDIQRELMTVMSHVATPDGMQNPRPLHCDELTLRMEEAIDRGSDDRPTGFVVPRGIVHVARAQCRTAERRLWTLHRQHPQDERILRMINRLSDYLFAISQGPAPDSHAEGEGQ